MTGTRRRVYQLVHLLLIQNECVVNDISKDETRVCILQRWVESCERGTRLQRESRKNEWRRLVLKMDNTCIDYL